MQEQTRLNLQEISTWKRGLYMLLFLIVYWVAKFVIYMVIFFQFLSVLITGGTNAQLLSLGKSLSVYVCQIMLYLTFNTEEQPYPFGKWPTVNQYQLENLMTTFNDSDR